MEIGYAVMFIMWMNTINFIQMKHIESKIDNITVVEIEPNKSNIKVIPSYYIRR